MAKDSPSTPSTPATSDTRPIMYAVLHSHLFFPGLGQYGPTLTLNADASNRKIDSMVWDGNTLTVVIKGREIILPSTSVFCVAPTK